MPINCKNWSRDSQFCYCFSFLGKSVFVYVPVFLGLTVNVVMLYLNFEIQCVVSEFDEQF